MKKVILKVSDNQDLFKLVDKIKRGFNNNVNLINTMISKDNTVTFTFKTV